MILHRELEQLQFTFFFIQKVAIELVAEEGGVPGSQYRKVFLANECNPVPFQPQMLKD